MTKLILAGSMGVLLVLLAAASPVSAHSEVSVVELDQNSSWSESSPFVPVANPVLREGNAIRGRVTLDRAADEHGVIVKFTSSDPKVGILAFSAIQPGSDRMFFGIVALWEAGAGSVTISAARTGSSVVKQAVLTVRRVQVSSLTFNSANVLEGSSATGTVSLEVDPTGSNKVRVNLSSRSASVSVPAYVDVGPTKTATFGARAGSPGTAEIQAMRVGGGSQQATLTVKSNEVKSLTLDPSTIVEGSASTGTVILDGTALPDDIRVGIATPGQPLSFFVSAPREVIVSRGTDRTTFTVKGINRGSATITAARSAGVSKQATLKVGYNEVKELTISPSTIAQGGTATGTVILNATANAVKLVRITTSNAGVATVPGLIPVQGGTDRTTFAITGAGPGSATISAKREGGDLSKPATVTVQRRR